MGVVVVRGAGDVGSAVAHALLTAGRAVLLHDVASPLYTRRGMAFVDAFFSGRAVLDSTMGKLADMESLAPMLQCRRAIPVCHRDLAAILPALQVDAIVDARMRKRITPEPAIGAAPVTVGIGPGFVAGRNVDIAIESAWGEGLGRVVRQGPTEPIKGEPRLIEGIGRERFVYAREAGPFTTCRSIGERVAEGEVIARVGTADVHSPISGVIRGLTHTGVEVPARCKIVEIDPRGLGRAITFGLGERPRTIAAGVLRALNLA
jgi:xanthine dehydrogenase accessory factor